MYLTSHDPVTSLHLDHFDDDLLQISPIELFYFPTNFQGLGDKTFLCNVTQSMIDISERPFMDNIMKDMNLYESF